MKFRAFADFGPAELDSALEPGIIGFLASHEAH